MKDGEIKKNFNIISLGNSYKERENRLAYISDKKIQEAAKEVESYLCDKEKYYKSVEENFEIGKNNFSMESLEILLKDLFS